MSTNNVPLPWEREESKPALQQLYDELPVEPPDAVREVASSEEPKPEVSRTPDPFLRQG